jgi:hypothetical protein
MAKWCQRSLSMAANQRLLLPLPTDWHFSFITT